MGIGVDNWVANETSEGKEKSRTLKMKAGSLCLVWIGSRRDGKLGDLSKVGGWKHNPSGWV